MTKKQISVMEWIGYAVGIAAILFTVFMIVFAVLR
nr:hypothetical protein [uncultured archaeon]